jgi:4-amino-4-deoxy-L-arabinose transferase-like glycosyltransferase
VNALFQVLCLLLLQRLARALAPPAEARAAGWLLQLLPIAFVFRIRANHEQLVLCFFLAALAATEAGRKRPLWFGAAALAATGVLLVKGVFAAIVPVSCALWLLWRPAKAPGLRPATWFGLAAVLLLPAIVAAGYEQLYRAVSGEPFWGPYVAQQLGLAARQHGDTPLMMAIQKLRNFGWYGGRVLWFAFPWGLVCLWLLAFRPRGPRRWRTALTADTALLLVLAGFYVAVLSLSDRRADRYAFPAYYLVGLAGMVAATRHWPIVRRLAGALARIHPLEHAMVWAVAFALALAPVWHQFPKFKLIDNY